jgi:large subunit ribosomal protein L28
MARQCAICAKGVKSSFQVSHSHIRTKRTWAPNLQRVRALIDGKTKRVNVCTRCLKSGKVKRVI